MKIYAHNVLRHTHLVLGIQILWLWIPNPNEMALQYAFPAIVDHGVKLEIAYWLGIAGSLLRLWSERLGDKKK